MIAAIESDIRGLGVTQEVLSAQQKVVSQRIFIGADNHVQKGILIDGEVLYEGSTPEHKQLTTQLFPPVPIESEITPELERLLTNVCVHNLGQQPTGLSEQTYGENLWEKLKKTGLSYYVIQRMYASCLKLHVHEVEFTAGFTAGTPFAIIVNPIKIGLNGMDVPIKRVIFGSNKPI